MLQIVPSHLGGQYEIQLDEEPPLRFDSYKPDLTKCEYTVPWHRTNLDNRQHNITIVVKGPSSQVGTISASQVEFGGLVYVLNHFLKSNIDCQLYFTNLHVIT